MSVQHASVAKPSTARHVDYQVFSTSLYDKRQEFDAILREHDYGIFRRSAELVDQMWMDDRISGVMRTRINGLLSAPVRWQPSSDKRKAKVLSELWGGHNDDAHGRWRESIGTPAASEMLKWGLMLGIAVAQKVWVRTGREWFPRIVPWHPANVRWDWWSRRFLIQTQDAGEIALPLPDEDPRCEGEWFVWCPYGVQYGWKSSLVRSLAGKFLARQWTERDWSRWCEKHGMPLMKAMVPATAEGENAERFFSSLSNMGSEAAAWCPQGDSPSASYDIEPIEFVGKTWDGFQAFKKELDTDIAICVLGQNLTTEVQSGSLAAAGVHNAVRLDIAKQDAEFWPAFRDAVVTWHAEYNYGDAALAPRPEAMVEPPEDDANKATGLKSLGDALLSLKTASDAIDIEALAEEYGLPLLAEVGDPDPVDEGAEGKVAAALSAGKARGGRYVDRVEVNAKVLANKALAPYLQSLRDTIAGSTSWEDVRKKIAKQYESLDTAKLAEVIRKAQIMSQLAGMHSALEEA